MEELRRARQHLQSFLLRHGRVFGGRAPWTRAHARWLGGQGFDHPAQQLVLAEYRQAVEDAGTRLERLTRQCGATRRLAGKRQPDGRSRQDQEHGRADGARQAACRGRVSKYPPAKPGAL